MADTSKRSTAKKSTSRSGKTSEDNPELRVSDDVRTAIISGAVFGTKAVQYANIDGRAIFEGDIDLGSVEDLERSTSAVRGLTIEESVVISGSQFRWPGGVVPYDIDSAMPDQQRVHDAIAHWEQNTVIRFVLRTSANASSHPDFVHFQHGGGCSSAVGMQGNGQQSITMGTGCDAGRGIHEIGHAVGLWHEQSREDRDMFVTIQWQNIQAGKEHNFNQHISDGDDVGAYDYGSIMHYERTAFTRNGQETVTPINPSNAQIGQRVALSQGDLAAVASMYGAPSPTFKKASDDGPLVTVKKFRDDGPLVVKKPNDDPPLVTVKKVRDDNLVPVKKIHDDVVVQPQFPRPPIGMLRPGLSPFLLATGHHAAVAGGPAAAGGQQALAAALGEASAAVDDARRNVVALQTALTGATSQLATAQESYDALAASIQSSS